MNDTLRHYYQLMKPGIIYGNALTAAAGYVFGAGTRFAFPTFLAMLFGTSLVIGGSCVINNFTDRSIDARMKRTKQRELVAGTVPSGKALSFAGALLASGFALLLLTNVFTVLIVGVGVIFYTLCYAYAKRRSAHGTMVGCVAGAVPITAGYVAATGAITVPAGLLFLILFLWQLPHFYAIATYRSTEYAAAKLPVASLAWGAARTKQLMLLYVALLGVAVVVPVALGYAGLVYLLAVSVVVGWWLFSGVRVSSRLPSDGWAKMMFGRSLVVLLVFSAAITLDPFVF